MENVPKQIQIPWGTSKTNVNLPNAEESTSQFIWFSVRNCGYRNIQIKRFYTEAQYIFCGTQIQYILRIQYNIINISSFCIPVKIVRIAVRSVVIPEMFVIHPDP